MFLIIALKTYHFNVGDFWESKQLFLKEYKWTKLMRLQETVKEVDCNDIILRKRYEHGRLYINRFRSLLRSQQDFLFDKLFISVGFLVVICFTD